MSQNLHKVTLLLWEEPYSVAKLPASAPIPVWLQPDLEEPDQHQSQPFVCVARSPDELSIVCLSDRIPPESLQEISVEFHFRLLSLPGPIPFDTVGIMAELARSLAESGISVFAVSTFNTDYLLVRDEDVPKAISALSTRGHSVIHKS